jgi:hypothetical protein
MLIGKLPQAADVILCPVSDDHEPQVIGKFVDASAWSRRSRPFLTWNAGEEKQHRLVGAPAKLRARIEVIRSRVAGEPERHGFDPLPREKGLESAGFRGGCCDHQISAIEQSFLDEVKVGPLFPPLVSPRPRLEHPVRGDDIRNAPRPASLRETGERPLP